MVHDLIRGFLESDSILDSTLILTSNTGEQTGAIDVSCDFVDYMGYHGIPYSTLD